MLDWQRRPFMSRNKDPLAVYRLQRELVGLTRIYPSWTQTQALLNQH